jgi:hypothetical protein
MNEIREQLVKHFDSTIETWCTGRSEDIVAALLSMPNLVVIDLDNVDELAKVAARCWPDTYANSWPWDTIPENAQNAYRKMVRDALCKGR